MTALTPRINGAYLNHHLNQTVRLVGRIHSLDVASGAMQVVTSDNKLVSVFSQALQAGEGAYDPNVYRQGGAVEVVGQLKQEDASVQEYTAISLGDTFGQSLSPAFAAHSTTHTHTAVRKLSSALTADAPVLLVSLVRHGAVRPAGGADTHEGPASVPVASARSLLACPAV